MGGLNSGRPIDRDWIEDHREQVMAMAQLGCTNQEISWVMDISERSVVKHFQPDLSEGRANLYVSIRKAQIETAIRDRNPSMLIWLGKTYLKQKDTAKVLSHEGAIAVERVMYADELDDQDD